MPYTAGVKSFGSSVDSSMSWFGLSAVHPLLLWGALAIAAPIIIHLLNKRKFRLIDWAAMDFLLEADRRNRRRVRLENLILLLLRCLAVALIAFLVARPFLTPARRAAGRRDGARDRAGDRAGRFAEHAGQAGRATIWRSTTRRRGW